MIRPLLRMAVVFAGTLGLLTTLGRVLSVASDWPLWAVAAGVAASIEMILWLFRYEAGAVSPRRARWILGLRLGALAVLVWILISPTWVRKVSRDLQREVVVILDDSASMHLKDDGSEITRLEAGEAALEEARVLERLREKLRVRVVRAGWEDSTDLVGALGGVLDQVPPDELAGTILVSDGRHNRPGRVEEVARRFGILDAPVGMLATGSAEPPKDAAVLAVRAPDAIHLGDRMRVAADLKFDGYKGAKAMVSLRRGDEVLEEREISIPQDHHREEVRFAQVPGEGGVGDYRIEIADLGGERFDANNGWDFETSITDARTNVLVIEGRRAGNSAICATFSTAATSRFTSSTCCWSPTGSRARATRRSRRPRPGRSANRWRPGCRRTRTSGGNSTSSCSATSIPRHSARRIGKSFRAASTSGPRCW